MNGSHAVKFELRETIACLDKISFNEKKKLIKFITNTIYSSSAAVTAFGSEPNRKTNFAAVNRMR
jgi:hypothetical protein